MRRTIVRYKYALVACLIVLFCFGRYLAEPAANDSHHETWAFVAHVAEEATAALIGALVTIFLIEQSNKEELRSTIERQLRDELAHYRQLRDDVRSNLQAEIASFRTLGQDFRADMQGAVLYRLFGHWSDKSIIERLNTRLFTKSLIRTKQDIVCHVVRHASQPAGTIDMVFDYDVEFHNLSRQPELRNLFAFSLDEDVVINRTDGTGTIESLTVARIPAGRTTPERAHPIDVSQLSIVLPQGGKKIFTFTVAGQDRHFEIEANGGMRWCFSYRTRQRISGFENFVVTDLTRYFSFRVQHEGMDGSRFRMAALTDSDGSQHSGAGTWSRLEITDILLPRQGISFSWDCHPDQGEALAPS